MPPNPSHMASSTEMCGPSQNEDIYCSVTLLLVGDGFTGCDCEGAIVDDKVCFNRLKDCTGGANSWCATFNGKLNETSALPLVVPKTSYATPSATKPKWCVSCEAETSLALLILPPFGVLLLLCAVVCALLRLKRKHPQSVR